MKKYSKIELKEDDNPLRVWLSHDVDWLKKNIIQTLYYTVTEKRVYHALNFLGGENNYWNFEAYQEIESKFGAKSTFFILNESIRPKLSSWRSIELGYGRYSIQDKRLIKKISELDESGWEIGMHGSYYSYDNFELLQHEKEVLENIVGHGVKGIRQHHLNNNVPKTWEIQKTLGFEYDSSYGAKYSVGFKEGYTYPFQPFQDNFTVFPVVLMDSYLVGITKDIKEGERIIVKIIQDAIKNRAVLSVIWHQRTYNQKEFPQLFHWYNFLLSEIKNNNGKFVMPLELIDSKQEVSKK